jgi:hypothetical protein
VVDGGKRHRLVWVWVQFWPSTLEKKAIDFRACLTARGRSRPYAKSIRAYPSVRRSQSRFRGATLSIM